MNFDISFILESSLSISMNINRNEVYLVLNIHAKTWQEALSMNASFGVPTTCRSQAVLEQTREANHKAKLAPRMEPSFAEASQTDPVIT